jgi:hypothetical protein
MKALSVTMWTAAVMSFGLVHVAGSADQQIGAPLRKGQFTDHWRKIN